MQQAKTAILFQSTLPREERQVPDIGKYNISAISIHAPTRGATESSTIQILFRRYFNPRSHERSDDVDFEKPLHIKISIHAPTRGATRSLYFQRMTRLFQSTLPREERPFTSLCVSSPVSVFQSTLPREERRITQQENTAREEFQSTLPREERRMICVYTRD